MHNQSTQLAEDHLKCLVERSWFISGGDLIEKKQKTTPLGHYYTSS